MLSFVFQKSEFRATIGLSRFPCSLRLARTSQKENKRNRKKETRVYSWNTRVFIEKIQYPSLCWRNVGVSLCIYRHIYKGHVSTFPVTGYWIFYSFSFLFFYFYLLFLTMFLFLFLVPHRTEPISLSIDDGVELYLIQQVDLLEITIYVYI